MKRKTWRKKDLGGKYEKNGFVEKFRCRHSSLLFGVRNFCGSLDLRRATLASTHIDDKGGCPAVTALRALRFANAIHPGKLGVESRPSSESSSFHQMSAIDADIAVASGQQRNKELKVSTKPKKTIKSGFGFSAGIGSFTRKDKFEEQQPEDVENH